MTLPDTALVEEVCAVAFVCALKSRTTHRKNIIRRPALGRCVSLVESFIEDVRQGCAFEKYSIIFPFAPLREFILWSAIKLTQRRKGAKKK
jgi:hypothetical protein